MRSIGHGAQNAVSPLSFSRGILSLYLRQLGLSGSTNASADAGRAASRLTVATLTLAVHVARGDIEPILGFAATHVGRKRTVGVLKVVADANKCNAGRQASRWCNRRSLRYYGNQR